MANTFSRILTGQATPIILLCFLLYGNTLNHDYALDDFVVITENIYTQQGLQGIWDILSKDTFAGHYGEQKHIYGGRYRPLSVVTFAIENAFYGNNPQASHLINLVLYAFTGIVLFKTLGVLFNKQDPPPGHFSIPLMATMIFLVHPIHTEVVANIKGRDEILALLFSLVTLYLVVTGRSGAPFNRQITVFTAYFLALLSKENAISFLLIIPVSLWFFTVTPKRDFYKWMVPMLAATAVYLAIRQLVVVPGVVAHSLLDDPYLYADSHQKVATILYTLGVYLKLLFIPHPLTWDYYPFHVAYRHVASIAVIASALIYVGMLLIAARGLKRKSTLAYAIIVYLIPLALVSNIFFNVGTFMAERFLYFSSVGFALACGQLLSVFTRKRSYTHIILLVIIAGVLAMITIDRNRDWKDAFTLYEHDLAISTNSAKSNIIMGDCYSKLANLEKDPDRKKALFEKAVRLTEKALKIYPDFIQAKFILANIAWDYEKDYEKTYRLYLDILKDRPDQDAVYRYAFKLLPAIRDEAFKKDLLYALYQINPSRPEVTYQLGLMHGRDNEADKAAGYFDKTLALKPNHAGALKFRGIIHYQNGKYREALRLLLDADAIKQGRDDVLTGYIANTYAKLGDMENRNTYLKILESR